MALEAPSATVVSEFNPRDPSILASGLVSGQVCSWDVRTGTSPVQMSHRQFSHWDCTTVVKWIATKSNTEFFSGSSDGRAMWWDTRKLRQPTEILVFDFETPNEPRMDRATGIMSGDYEPSVGTKFMFGFENGMVISGSRKARTPADKMALRFNAHYSPVFSVDRSGFNPKIFMTIGDCTARFWAEDTRDSSLVATRFIPEGAICGCWNKTRHSVFYVATRIGVLTIWDLLEGLQEPILAVKLCEQKLTAVASHEMGSLVAVGNSAGYVYLVELTKALYTFDKNDRIDLTSYLDRCSRFAKAIDTKMKEIKLTRTAEEPPSEVSLADLRDKKKDKRLMNDRNKRKIDKERLKETREKSKIISKKKLKEESPELQEVEDKFFEIVKREKQQYEELEDLDISSSKISRFTKKFTGRKIEKDSHLPIDEATELEKMPPKKIFKVREKYPKKTETVEISKAEIAQDVEQEKAMAEEPLPLLAEEPLPPLVEAIVESPLQEISKRKRRKKARKKRLRPVIFRLARPCKVVVCKPNICCRRTTSRKLIRPTDRTVKDREKWSEVDERTRSKDDIRTRSSIKDKMKRKERECWTKLLRVYKRRELTREYSGEEKIRFFQKIMAPPEEFASMTEDVRKAKKEIQEANMARTKARELTKKTLKSRAMAAEKSRDTSRGSEGGEEKRVKEVTSRTRRILTARMGKKMRTVVMTDRCIPWEPPSLAKDLQTLFVGFLPESIDKETKPDVA
ncbi:dynein intermediate chain 3, ciliary [Monomorium pharaonis]|uniref:dynein intermediate chain 3, ciliary n=1 Tax=Monomorium pharaonis TaxID=307658 RepID=UPI00102E1FA2|nr:dynein intermediate chain 3, ciliary [Monomorium pharaonis]